ncbi:endonuclease/exonuclease/phosphatase family protein [Streptomyces sp. NPDC032198]|uniref:endonuclease/exonuclease/phosphatase family protein n=1 Tax=unclassified Streptomyces TaxID=2593676 RepID=UPI0033C0E28F
MAQTQAPFDNRVATFNVFNPSDQLEKPQIIAAEVAKYRPQVIAFQEICVSQTNRVREILEEDYGLTYHVQHGSVLRNWTRCGGTPWNPGAFGNAILSAAPISNAENHIYRAGGSENRGYVAVDTTVAGKPVRVFATHLAQGPQGSVRRQQVSELLENVLAYNDTIVLGDFNSEPTTEVAPMFTWFRDADPECTATQNRPPCQPTADARPYRKKFDYILLRNGSFTAPGVGVHDNYSDHDLVHADLTAS